MESLFNVDESEKLAAFAKMIAREVVREIAAANAAVDAAGGHDDVVTVGSLTVDSRRHEVRVAGKRVDVKPREFLLLRVLAENPGRAFTRTQLLDCVAPLDNLDVADRTIDVHVSRLRVRLGEAGHCVQTIKGVGYRLDDS